MRIDFKGNLAAIFGISGGLLIGLSFLCIGGIVGMFCWPWGINNWLVFAGKEPAMLWWQGFLLGMIPVFGKWSLIFAVITWIILMFL